MSPFRQALAGLALGMAAVCSGAQASAPDTEGGLQATALIGTPVAGGQGRSGRATLEPSFKWSGSSIEWRVQPRLRQLRQDGQSVSHFDWRTLTAAWRGPSATLTVGAQQVNWGRMDILRVADVVNPVDQHDLFHEELPESKRPLWMANVEWQDGPHTLQLLATPQVAVDRVPARWFGLPVNVMRPDHGARHGTAALRYGTEADGWNLDLIAVRGRETTPSLTPAVDASGLHLLGTSARQSSVGASADKPLGRAVLRLEGLYARTTPDPAGTAAGLAPGRQATLGAGLDLRPGPWFLAGQVIARHGTGARDGMRDRQWISVIVQRQWLQDRLQARVLHVQDVRGPSRWTSAQVLCEWTPHQVLKIQADRFSGDPDGTFGSFATRSRLAVSAQFKY